MRRLIAFALAAATTIPFASARAAEAGTIEGRAVNGDSGKLQPGVRVTLTGAAEDGSNPVRETVTTDENGFFSFKELPTGDDRIYVIDAYFDRGLFAGRALRLPSDTAETPVIDTTIEVWESTTDPTVIDIVRDDLFLVPADGALTVVESVRVLNFSERAYVGRGADDGNSTRETTSMGFALPEGAEQVRIIDSNLDIPKLVPAEYGFGVTVAIPPDESHLTFSYLLSRPGSQFDISRTVLYPTEELSVYVRPPLTIESNRLTYEGKVPIEGTTYKRWATNERIESGDLLQALAIAEAGVPLALIGGIGAFVVIVLAAGMMALRKKGRRTRATELRVPNRDDVMTAIARLDLKYQAGDIERDAWDRERARLKHQLTERESAP